MQKTPKAVRSGIAVSVIALAAALAVAPGFDMLGGKTGAASAQQQGAQQGEGQGGPGNQGGQDNQGGDGSGQGGPSADSGAQGPQAGAPADTGGGKPVWAQEGIPAVELGRLSVARSPDQVLDRALAEALATFVPAMEDFYEMSLDEMIEELSLNWDNVTIYDSPLQNLALMKDLLADGATQLPITNDKDTLLAVFLGVASDKTIEISADTVIAVTTILGYPITGQAAIDLAVDAEFIRIAVLAGHG
jgi:hypothetical protein